MSKLLKFETVAKFATVGDDVSIPDSEKTVLYIEGYASVNRTDSGDKNIDRDGEVYDIPSLNIDNYRANGPIVFNHNWNAVIGQVTHIEKTFKGLYIKAEIHKISGLEYVFEGIQKGLIKAFSISAIPETFTYLDDIDAVELGNAELVEISVLAVPSNAQSLFSVTKSKSLQASAKQVAEQNGLTLCELKGICGFTPKEKGTTMDVKKKEVEVTPEGKEPKTEDAPKVEEPKKEEKLDAVTIAQAITEANRLAQETLKAEEEAKQKADEEAKQKAEEEAKARVLAAKDYIKEKADEISNTSIEDFDIDAVEEFYELVSNAADLVETKVTEAITKLTQPAAA